MTNDERSGFRRGRRRSWVPEIVGDRYRVEGELGSGAAAVTVAATDEKLGRRVAVKLLKPAAEIDPEFSRRFAREARAAASVNHANVVNVYDVGQDGDLLYLVMQYVDGMDLKHVVEREGALPWKRACAIAGDVLAGLSAIHASGIVHRDIKPQNVLIGNDGSVKVTDFGVAHVELDSAGLTTAGMTVGTASYMAPEQAQGNTPTPSADVYAVGVMLYEMVTGRLPFLAPTPVAVMLAHIQEEAPPPAAPSGMERLPRDLVAVIRQAMMKDPKARFRSAGAMGSALGGSDSWTSGATTGSAAQTGRTEVVSPLQGDRRSTTGRRVSANTESPRRGAPPREPRSEPPERSGGGFGAFFVSMLVVLALGLVATAGVLWYMEQQPTGDSPETPTPVSAGVETVQQAEDTPTPQNEAPGLIAPFSTDTPAPTEPPAPTVTPAPTDTPVTIDTPTPTAVLIVPSTEEPPPPDGQTSTEPGEGMIIEPIGTSPVPTGG